MNAGRFHSLIKSFVPETFLAATADGIDVAAHDKIAFTRPGKRSLTQVVHFRVIAISGGIK